MDFHNFIDENTIENSSLHLYLDEKETGQDSGKQGYPFCVGEIFNDEFQTFGIFYDSLIQTNPHDKLLDESKDMKEQCRLFEHTNKDYLTKMLVKPEIKSSDAHKDISYLRKNIQVVLSENRRYLVTEKKLKLDTCIISEIPTILELLPVCICSQNKEYAIYRCHHCGVAVRKFICCKSCDIVVYCSQVCHDEAYSYHKYECYGFQRHFWCSENLTDHTYLAFRMMLFGLEHNLDVKSPPNFQHNYASIYKLTTSFKLYPYEDIHDIMHQILKSLIYLSKKTFFFHDISLKKNKTEHDLYKFLGGLMLKHYCQAQQNFVLLQYYNLNAEMGFDKISNIGKAICPTISFMNHSCQPNCIVVAYNNGVAVRTIRNIDRGEELTICYAEVNPLLNVYNRRLITSQLHYFTCDCVFCCEEFNMPKAAYKCKLCADGKAFTVVSNNVEYGVCLSCQGRFKFTQSRENIQRAKISQKLYKLNNDTKYLTRFLDLFTKIYHSDSIQMFDALKMVFHELENKKDVSFEIMKCGIVIYKTLESHISPYYIPLLVAKVKFFKRIANNPELYVLELTDENIEILHDFAAALFETHGILKFYLPTEYTTFFHNIENDITDLLRKKLVLKV